MKCAPSVSAQSAAAHDLEEPFLKAVSCVQALDILTPLGRGQALLVTGMRGAGKTSLVLDAILGQYKSGVRCIYAAIGQRCFAMLPAR